MSEDGMTIQLQGTEQLRKNLNQLDKKVRGIGAVRIVTAGAYQIVNHARQNIHRTFSKRQTGGLTNSISVEAEKKGQGAVAHVIPHKVYARIQEMGDTIVPKKAGGFLVWRDPDTGKLIRARSVTLPARPYLEPAAVDHQDDIVQAMTAESFRVLSEVNQ